VPVRGEEPQRVLQDRAAQRRVDVIQLLDLVNRGQPLRPQPIVQVAALQRAVAEVSEQEAAVAIAPFLRNQVDADAAVRRLGRVSAKLEVELLYFGGIGGVAAVAAVTRQPREAVQLGHHVLRVAAVDRDVSPFAGEAADVLSRRTIRIGRHHAGNHLADCLEAPRARQRIQDLARDDLALNRVVDVHRWRVAGDGDALFQRPDRQVGVDRRGERGRQRDAAADSRGESGQRERHVIDAGPQVDDRVAAFPVGDRGPRALDQRRARRLDGHTWEHRARDITHQPGNPGRLPMHRPDCGNREHDRDRHRTAPLQPLTERPECHVSLLVCENTMLTKTGPV
jgi:hypothetical protein